jgi:hypothetical protein
MGDMPFHHCAAVVLHWAGQQGGYPAGSFVGHLLDAFGSADPENFRLLTSAYPTLGAAMAIYKHWGNGVAVLQLAIVDQAVAAPELMW